MIKFYRNGIHEWSTFPRLNKDIKNMGGLFTFISSALFCFCAVLCCVFCFCFLFCCCCFYFLWIWFIFFLRSRGTPPSEIFKMDMTLLPCKWGVCIPLWFNGTTSLPRAYIHIIVHIIKNNQTPANLPYSIKTY